MLQALMEKYALDLGYEQNLATEVADASMDQGIYTFAFDKMPCTISEESDLSGEPVALAIAHLCVLPVKDIDSLFQNMDLLARNAPLLAPVATLEEETLALGFATRLPLQGLSDNAFIAWMGQLENICRSELKTNLKKEIIDIPKVGNANLKAIFEAAGGRLEGDDNTAFWALSLPGNMLIVECDLQSGNAYMRSLVGNALAHLEIIKIVFDYNMQFTGQSWLTCIDNLLWLRSPLFPAKISTANNGEDLRNLIGLHLNNSHHLGKKLSTVSFTTSETTHKEADNVLLMNNAIRI